MRSQIKLMKYQSINLIIMFSWVSQCWGGMGVTSSFEKARIACTYADWSMPSRQSMAIIMGTLKGENPETNPQTAITQLFSHLQQGEDRTNPAFMLKNLVILDFTVQQRIFLTKISHYYNSQFLYLQGNNTGISSSVKDLISSYYVYIKEKAKQYGIQAPQLINKDQRETYLKAASTSELLNQINICFKIQNQILIVSDKFLYGNKSVQLIQLIFGTMLKTYLFCYSIVAIALKSYIDRINQLSKYDLEYLARLARYVNKDYTRNFLLFVERNKMIDVFKEIKYNEMIVVDERILDMINLQLAKVEQETSAPCPMVETPIDFKLDEDLVIEIDPENEKAEQRETETIAITRRKKFDLTFSTVQSNTNEFDQYKNFYNEDFIIDENDSQARTEPISIPAAKVEVDQNISEMKLSKKFSAESSGKFDKNVWDSWNNVYSP